MSRKQAKKRQMGWLTDRKTKAKGGSWRASQGGKWTTQPTCAANKAGGTLSETPKHYQWSQQVVLVALWVWPFRGSGGSGVGRAANHRTLQEREQQVNVWAVMSHVGAKASTSLSWRLINETVSSFHRFLPSSLPPGWPFNIRSKRRPSHYRHVSTRWGHYGVNSQKVYVMRRDDSAVMCFTNVEINKCTVHMVKAVAFPVELYSSIFTFDFLWDISPEQGTASSGEGVQCLAQGNFGINGHRDWTSVTLGSLENVYLSWSDFNNMIE